jgi:hypothetical protein
MVASSGTATVRVQLAPENVDLSGRTRESVMDRHPALWRTMAAELQREGKIRAFGTVAGENIGDPRTYLYVNYAARHRDSSFDVLVRLRNDRRWHSSSLGRPDYQVARNGWVRTTIELPPGTLPAAIGEIAFRCDVAIPSKDRKPALAGLCRLEAGASAFMIGSDYRTHGEFQISSGADVPTGQTVSIPWTYGSK